MKLILRLFLGLILFVVVAVIALVVATQFFPPSYRVERSVVIQASPEQVFAQVGDLRSWKNWTIWHHRDPQMELAYSDVSNAPGAWHSWKSRTEGNGKFTVTEWKQNEIVAYRLEFPDFQMESDGRLALQPASDATKVTWTCTGQLSRNPMHRIFGLFMDKLVGTDFEQGLSRMKSLTESK